MSSVWSHAFWQARHSQNARARHVERVESCRVETWRAKWNSGFCVFRAAENELESVPTPGKPSLKMRLFQAGGTSRDLLCSVFDTKSQFTSSVTPPCTSASKILHDGSSRLNSLWVSAATKEKKMQKCRLLATSWIVFVRISWPNHVQFTQSETKILSLVVYANSSRVTMITEGQTVFSLPHARSRLQFTRKNGIMNPRWSIDPSAVCLGWRCRHVGGTGVFCCCFTSKTVQRRPEAPPATQNASRKFSGRGRGQIIRKSWRTTFSLCLRLKCSKTHLQASLIPKFSRGWYPDRR